MLARKKMMKYNSRVRSVHQTRNDAKKRRAWFFGAMSIINWLTGGGSRNQELAEEVSQETMQLRSDKSMLERRLMQATADNKTLLAQMEEARHIIEHTEAVSSPESEAVNAHVESLKRAHAAAVDQFAAEHKERLHIETELNEAQLALQKAQFYAQHAKNANVVLEERVDITAKSAEEASEYALKIESEKDNQIIANETQIGGLVRNLNQMKVEQMALKRDLAACSSASGQASGNLQTIHGFTTDVVNGSRNKYI
jgi:chromosome segregation ATPase